MSDARQVSPGAGATLSVLSATSHSLNDFGGLPAAPGLYAWWASPTVLPQLPGTTHTHSEGLRLLYIGLAKDLRRRIRGAHLRRTRKSTLRRTLAGFLLSTEDYRTRRTDRVVLVREDEARLTEWMHTYLRLSWCLHPAPAEVEATLIQQWEPPLNVTHTRGPARAIVEATRTAFSSSA